MSTKKPLTPAARRSLAAHKANWSRRRPAAKSPDLSSLSAMELERELLTRAMERTEAALHRAQATLAALQAKGRAQATEMVQLCDRIVSEREVRSALRRMKGGAA